MRQLERRVQRFDALTEEERRILAVVAVFPCSIRRHVVIQMGELISSRASTRAIENSRLTMFAQSWQQLDLVCAQGSEVRCDPDLSAYLVRRIEDTPFGLPIRCSIESNPSWWMTLSSAADNHAYETRLLRLAGRSQEARASAARFLQSCRSEVREIAVLFGPGDPWFVPIHVSEWQSLLSEALESGVRGLSDASWELELLEVLSNAHGEDPQALHLQSLLLPADARDERRASVWELASTDPLEQRESYRRLWYTWHLFRGDDLLVRDAAARHLRLGYVDVEAFLAIADLSSDTLESCLERFARACVSSRRNAPSATQTSWAGVVRVLALLASDAPEHASLATDQIQRLLGKRSCYSDEPAAVLRLADYALQRDSTSAVLPRPAQQLRESPISLLVALILLVWRKCHVSNCSEWIAAGQRMRGLADALSHQWLVHQLDVAMERLHALSSNEAPAKLVVAQNALVELTIAKPDWAMTLDSMGRIADSVLPPPPTYASRAEPNTRIAWFVEVRQHQLYAEPRLQSRKGASFGRGKAIALERLLTAADDLPMTAADTAIAAHIVRGFPSRNQPECNLEPGFCLALVGHPCVFDLHNESFHYEVRRGHVRLRCIRLNDGSHRLWLEPPIDANRSEVQFTSVNARELNVYEVTPNLRKLSRLIGDELLLPAEAGPQLQQLLPRLSALLPTSANLELEPSADVAQSDTLPVLRILPRAGALRVQCVVTPLGSQGIACRPGEGDTYLADRRAGRTLHVQRDLLEEQERARLLLRTVPSLRAATEDFEWMARGTLECLTLISELSELQAGVARVEWPEGEPLKLRRVQSLKVSLNNGNGQSWFEVEGTAHLSDASQLRVADLVHQIGYAGGRFVQISKDDYLELGQSTLKCLQLLEAFRQGAQDDAVLRLAPWIALALPDDSLQEFAEAGSDSWTEWRQRVSAVTKTRPHVPPGFVGTLRDYQLAGFEWLVRMAELGSGVCLADDMGLGKTVQTLALLLHRATRELKDESARPILIVAPASVCPVWLAEAARFTPELELRWLNGSERNLLDLTRRTVLVCTYEILYRDREALSEVNWDTVVLDEAQHIKNAHTHRARVAFALRAEFRLATTGTPIENHLGELWSLFRFLMPGLLGEQHEFVERFRAPIENERNAAVRQQLQILVRPFLLRRSKQQVLSELPARTELVRQVELSPQELELYESVRQRGLLALSTGNADRNQQRIRVLSELMRLRRACCHPKLVLKDSEVASSKQAALLDLVEELREGGHRALVFSQFVDHLSLVREALDDRGICYQYLDGSTPISDRARRVEAFQSGSSDLFLISLRAGGTGLNLTAADYVIHLDPWWNPAVEDQASDRAHRIGQERPVTIYRLVARGTIEERLITMHAEKRMLAADILQGAEKSARLDPDDLINLLREACVTVNKAGASAKYAIDSHPE